MSTIIVAPHPDDEIIGCFEVLNKAKSVVIIYSPINDLKRQEEVLKLKDKYENIKMQMFQYNIPSNFLNSENQFYFPDPVYEIHPKHREIGMAGELFARAGFDVTFYNTNMNAPYIHEVENWQEKESTLNEIYPSQKSLWEYEKKYVLFEGYCKWIF